MEFTLVYQGQLTANGSIKDKQNIRREFHKQLAELWKQEPLSSRTQGDPALLNNVVTHGMLSTNLTSLMRSVNNFQFIRISRMYYYPRGRY